MRLEFKDEEAAIKEAKDCRLGKQFFICVLREEKGFVVINVAQSQYTAYIGKTHLVAVYRDGESWR